jgi:hypothetical protein
MGPYWWINHGVRIQVEAVQKIMKEKGTLGFLRALNMFMKGVESVERNAEAQKIYRIGSAFAHLWYCGTKRINIGIAIPTARMIGPRMRVWSQMVAVTVRWRVSLSS